MLDLFFFFLVYSRVAVVSDKKGVTIRFGVAQTQTALQHHTNNVRLQTVDRAKLGVNAPIDGCMPVPMRDLFTRHCDSDALRLNANEAKKRGAKKSFYAGGPAICMYVHMRIC